ncbi:hypothetical protein KM043_002504 [Ampulex compressa]|nr:hypothetical protein KM043_002504 [Ampulex compressa]
MCKTTSHLIGTLTSASNGAAEKATLQFKAPKVQPKRPLFGLALIGRLLAWWFSVRQRGAQHQTTRRKGASATLRTGVCKGGWL